MLLLYTAPCSTAPTISHPKGLLQGKRHGGLDYWWDEEEVDPTIIKPRRKKEMGIEEGFDTRGSLFLEWNNVKSQGPASGLNSCVIPESCTLVTLTFQPTPVSGGKESSTQTPFPPPFTPLPSFVNSYFTSFIRRVDTDKDCRGLAWTDKRHRRIFLGGLDVTTDPSTTDFPGIDRNHHYIII